jgi:hypothetical protein
MSDTGRDDEGRNREIAKNEAERQATGDIRVSAWAVIVTVVGGCIVAAVVWAWLHR